MAPKKKKGKKKKKEKKEGEEEENKEELNPAFNITLPEYGWIRIELRLCDPPTRDHNKHLVVMRTSDRILELKKRIIEYHGRIDNIAIYNKDPIPERTPDRKRQIKPRVPPYGQNTRLRALQTEKIEKDEKAELKKKRNQKLIDDNKQDEISADEEPEMIKNDDPFNKSVPVDKYEELKHWDFPIDPVNGHEIFEYDEKELSLYEIFGNYGTVIKPKLQMPDKDEIPPKIEKPVVVKPPTPKVVEPKEDDDEDGEGNKEEVPIVEEEPEEEVYIPPLHKILYYDFSTYKNAILKKEDPILLALMVKGDMDQFTL